jgi:hypothetical protein
MMHWAKKVKDLMCHLANRVGVVSNLPTEEAETIFVDEEFERQKERIPGVKFSRICQRYADADPYPGYSKYLNVDKWLGVAIQRAEHLRLPSENGLDILDIGTGAGYFPFVCESYGHSCLALDVPDVEMYNELTELLGVQRRDWRIEAFEPLPDMGKRHDLVTAFSICFNNHGTDRVWGEKEWAFFLDDLCKQHLKRGGAVYLELNREPCGEFYTEKLRQFFLDRRAEIEGKKVLLRTEECQILDGLF